MSRVDKLRAARSSLQVVFSDYLKLRSRWKGLVLVFEGKYCPTVYITWIARAFPDLASKQLIAKGKKNVIQLRELIHRNCSTSSDINAYFVDRDYDSHPAPGEFGDVYVSRGYSIENELVGWRTVERYIRANFYINCADDDESMSAIHAAYQKALGDYLESSRAVQRAVFVCRRREVECFPGDDIRLFLVWDWCSSKFEARQVTNHDLLAALKVNADRRDEVVGWIEDDVEFASLDPVSSWRGKFHFDFVRRFLAQLNEARREGCTPFTNAERSTVDPAHPSVLGHLAAFTQPPECFTKFVTQYSEAGVSLFKPEGKLTV